MSTEAELRLRYQTNRFRETRHQMAPIESNTASTGPSQAPSIETIQSRNSGVEAFASGVPVTSRHFSDPGTRLHCPAPDSSADGEESGTVNVDVEPITAEAKAESGAITAQKDKNRCASHTLSSADESMDSKTGTPLTSEPSTWNVQEATPLLRRQGETQIQRVTSDDPEANSQFPISRGSVVEPILSTVPLDQNSDVPALSRKPVGTENSETMEIEDDTDHSLSAGNTDCGQLDGVVCSARRSRHVQESDSDSEPGHSLANPPDGNDTTADTIPAASGEIAANEVAPPRWQPDAEATYCPICRTQFNFFVRKHHCRKCGRVVCASCSPHRITIPYQFIVQPPAPGPVTTLSGVPLSRRDTDSLSNFGGMKVRLCNPCVPDPNIMPPQPLRTAADERWRDAPPTYYLSSSSHQYSFGEQDMENLERQTSGVSARSRAASSTSAVQRHQQLSQSPYPPRSSSQANYLGGTSYTRPYNINQGPSPYQRRYPNRSLQGPRHQSHQSLSISSSGSPSNVHLQPHCRSLVESLASQQTQSSNSGIDTSRPLPPIPRIREEDECPVCHRELPSRTLPDFEILRSNHINKCIEEQIALHSGRARQQSPANTPDRRISPSAAATASSASAPPHAHSRSPNSTASSASSRDEISLVQAMSLRPSVPSISLFPNTPEGRMAYREAQHAAVVLGHSRSSSNSLHAQPTSSFSTEPRRTGMFPYKATEKDCVDDAECTICLEEFEEGVQMARLECLCRFHEKCIMSWWEGKPGRCPVHGHDAWGL